LTSTNLVPTPDSPGTPNNPENHEWQTQNLAAIHARLEALRKLKDGTIYVEPSGIHFHVILKEGPSLRFLLVEQTDPNTGVVQSEIDIDRPLFLTEPYTQAMLLSLVWRPQPKQIYMAGLGGGRLAMLLHHYLPDVHIISTDIDPPIVTVAIGFFGFLPDERLQVVIEDGRKWLEVNDATFDIILLDVFLDKGYSSYRMTTVEFFELCRQRLSPGGVVAINVISGDEFTPAKAHTLSVVFPHVYTFTVPGDNIVLLASEQELALDVIRTRAAQLDAKYAFPFPFRENGALVVTGLGELEADAQNAPLLTDADPPPAYFESLPSFNAPFSTVAPDLPCPCGSGLRFAECHGAPPPQ
jgi:spermidine synthase